MKKLTTKWMILVLAVSLTGCVELQQIMGTMMAGQPLTTTEIIAGLKQALTIGADSSLKKNFQNRRLLPR